MKAQVGLQHLIRWLIAVAVGVVVIVGVYMVLGNKDIAIVESIKNIFSFG